MINRIPAQIALRASRGYVFSAVASAVVLTALAFIQYLQPAQTVGESHVVFITPASSSNRDLPRWLEPDVSEQITNGDALTKAQQAITGDETAGALPPAADLRDAISVAVVPNGPGGRRSIRLAAADASPHWTPLLHSLAEQFVDGQVSRPQAEASEDLQSAESSLAAAQSKVSGTEARLRQLEREVARHTTDLHNLELQVASARRRLDLAVHSSRTEPVEQTPRIDDSASLARSLQDLQDQRTRLLRQFTARHPIVQDVDTKIAELSAVIQGQDVPQQPAQSPAQAASASADQFQQASRELAALEQAQKQLQDALSSLELKRDAQAAALASLEEDLRRRETEVGLAKSELGNVQGVELVVTDASNLGEAAPLVGAYELLFSLALGCTLGVVACLRVTPTNGRLGNRSEIESILALPIIGLLPGNDDDDFAEAKPRASDQLNSVARRVRSAAELTLGLFLLATVVGIVCVDGYKARLTAEPLSAAADSFREVAHHFFT